jgi:ribosome biogenesis GTPase A
MSGALLRPLHAAAAAAPAAPFSSRYGSVLNWFPGHMARAAAAVAARARAADVLVEVRDARAPLSSAAALLPSGGGGGGGVGGARKPRVVVLNKSDLASAPLASRAAAAVRAADGGALAAAAVLHASLRGGGGGGERAHARAVLAAVDALPSRAAPFRVAGRTLLVLGMSNVGKSSLVNALRSLAAAGGGALRGAGAATGAAPGITRAVSTLRIRAAPPTYMFDTPGVVPPRIATVDQGMRLLLCGILPPTAAPAVVQAEFLLHYFATLGGSRHYAPALRLRRAYAPDEVEACLADLAGVLRARAPGGAPCLDTAARHMVKEFQSGALGEYVLDALPGEG